MTARSHGLLWLKEHTKEDTYRTGKTGAKFGELLQAGFPIHDGFIVTTDAYFRFLHDNKLIKLLADLLSTINYEQPDSVHQVAGHIKKRLFETKISENFMHEIISAYNQLNGTFRNAPVVVHFEPTHPHFAQTPKQTHTQIHGDTNLIQTIKKAWASHFEPEALLHRHHNHIPHFQDGIAIVIQKTTTPELSGIVLTQDPITHDKNKLIIEVATNAPDHYILDKKTAAILEKKIAGETEQLSSHHIFSLAEFAKKIEIHSYFPQEIRWVINQGKIIFDHIRPLTLHTLSNTASISTALPLLLRGISASKGIATGKVKMIASSNDLETVIPGDMLVAKQLGTTHKQALKKAGAIITDKDGRTSPIALFAREYGIPTIVGTQYATTQLKPHQIITVDATSGHIYQGSPNQKQQRLTATHLYLQINNPAELKNIQEHFDGIFLAQPLNELHEIRSITPLMYRLSDTEDSNNLLGYQGTYRLLTDSKHFHEEIMQLHKFTQQHKHLHLVLPFVRSVKELTALKHALAEEGITRSAATKFWMEIALPGNVILLEEFIKQGIDGIAINIDLLTMLLLGTTKEDHFVAHAYDDLDPAVLSSIEQIIKTAHKHSLPTIIFGHAPSHHQSLIERLVSWGISAIAIEPTQFYTVQKQVITAERDLIT